MRVKVVYNKRIFCNTSTEDPEIFAMKHLILNNCGTMGCYGTSLSIAVMLNVYISPWFDVKMTF